MFLKEAIATVILLLIVVSFIPFARIYFKKKTTQKVQLQGRDPFFDFARGVAIIAVILIHVAYFFVLYKPGAATTFIVGFNNLLRFAMPFFIIASGALLRPEQAAYGKRLGFYSTKILRIFIPYGIVVLVFSLYGGLNAPAFLYALISGTTYTPYYFIIVLLQCYLLYPWLIRWRNSRNFLIASLVISVASFLAPRTWFIYDIPLVTQYLFFFAYGMYYRENMIHPYKSKSDAGVWWALIGLYIVVMSLLFDYYYNSRFVYCIAVFNILLLYYGDIRRFLPKFTEGLTKLGGISLWIFLLHFPISRLLFMQINKWQVDPYTVFAVTSCVSIGASVAAAVVVDMAYTKVTGFAIRAAEFTRKQFAIKTS